MSTLTSRAYRAYRAGKISEARFSAILDLTDLSPSRFPVSLADMLDELRFLTATARDCYSANCAEGWFPMSEDAYEALSSCIYSIEDAIRAYCGRLAIPVPNLCAGELQCTALISCS